MDIRRIVNISTVQSGTGHYTLYIALCSDGTVWRMEDTEVIGYERNDDLKWEQLPEIPQIEAE